MERIFKNETDEIVDLIKQGEHFETTTRNGAFKVKIDKYVPYICTAIHNGNKIRSGLQNKIALNDYERWYEEDPFTGDFIVSMPITIIVNDSRFEYDLNRKPEDCIYEEAWGKQVWKKKLTSKEITISKQKHADYYTILHAIVQKLESQFGGCVIYDIHSYNHKRWDRDVPLFNIGAERIDMKRFGTIVNDWKEQLATISIADILNQTSINDVFYGKGFNMEYVHSNFKNSLVLATEIKKVYCNELSGDAYPKIIRTLQLQLKKAIVNNANSFAQTLTKWKYPAKEKLLAQSLDKNLLKIDKDLFKLLQNFELLSAIVPQNTNTEKKRFFKNRFAVTPKFTYHPTQINVPKLKAQLLNLPIDKIKDISVRNMYEAVINSYFDKLDLIATVGSSKFLYNSLRYFGQPSKRDLHNASYLLLLPNIPGEATREPLVDAQEAMHIFKEKLNEYNIDAKIIISNQIVSRILVLNSKKTIIIHPDVSFRKKEVSALAEHEIGVHMTTTMNAAKQQLQIFNIGLPVNTLTQEGLAVLSEYLSGNITLQRLKNLALRVIAVDMMCSGADFIEVFNEMRGIYKLENTAAYDLVTRVFRGGGFTKDYLYLRGFVKILRFWEKHHDLGPLLVGKTSIEFYHTINELIQREMIQSPIYIPKSFEKDEMDKNNPIYNYILSGLK